MIEFWKYEKKLIVFAMFLSALMISVDGGCGAPEIPNHGSDNKPVKRFEGSGARVSITVVKDAQTGKEYLCVQQIGIIEIEPTKPEAAK